MCSVGKVLGLWSECRRFKPHPILDGSGVKVIPGQWLLIPGYLLLYFRSLRWCQLSLAPLIHGVLLSIPWPNKIDCFTILIKTQKQFVESIFMILFWWALHLFIFIFTRLTVNCESSYFWRQRNEKKISRKKMIFSSSAEFQRFSIRRRYEPDI